MAVAECKAHMAADALIQGQYSKTDGQACMIGCLYDGRHSQAPAKHGFSEKFARLCDRIFEMHLPSDCAAFPLWVMENVPQGADTDRIWWEFFALTMQNVSPEFAQECREANPDMKKPIARAIDLDLDLDLDLAIANFKLAVGSVTVLKK